jgi:hypothetical protein
MRMRAAARKEVHVELLKRANAVVAFLLELAMLAGFAVWGAHIGTSPLGKWGLAVGLALLATLLWGFCFAPRATWRLPIVPGALLSLGLFLLAAVALFQAGLPTAGIVLAVIAVINRVLVLCWRQW